jgi:hemin uptake protein HemP
MRSILARTDALKAINHAEAKLAAKAVDAQLLDSRALFSRSSEVVITHGTETYRLRLTRQNKLILTK